MRNKKDDLEISIYHERQSFEVGFESGHTDERHSMSVIIRAHDPGAADHYRNAAATTEPGPRCWGLTGQIRAGLIQVELRKLDMARQRG